MRSTQCLSSFYHFFEKYPSSKVPNELSKHNDCWLMCWRGWRKSKIWCSTIIWAYILNHYLHFSAVAHFTKLNRFKYLKKACIFKKNKKTTVINAHNVLTHSQKPKTAGCLKASQLISWKIWLLSRWRQTPTSGVWHCWYVLHWYSDEKWAQSTSITHNISYRQRGSRDAV